MSRNTQSTLARDFRRDMQPEPELKTDELWKTIREAQLAAFSNGCQVGMESTLKTMRKEASRWLSLNDEDLRQMVSEFAKGV